MEIDAERMICEPTKVVGVRLSDEMSCAGNATERQRKRNIEGPERSTVFWAKTCTDVLIPFIHGTLNRRHRYNSRLSNSNSRRRTSRWAERGPRSVSGPALALYALKSCHLGRRRRLALRRQTDPAIAVMMS